MTDTVYNFDAPRGWQVTITLEDIEPPIWRQLILPDSLNFAGLHEVIQAAFGWTNSHLHQFSAAGIVIGAPEFDRSGLNRHRTFEATDVSLSDLIFLQNHSGVIFYEYDFGDSWIHAILFEEPVILQSGNKYPLLLEGKRSGPPEDCGGPHGYQSFLEAWSDPRHEGHAQMKKWAGKTFNPEAFDPAKVQKAILTALRKAQSDYRFRQNQ